MAENPGAVATEPMTVDVRSVEKELNKLWQKAAEGDMPGVNAPLTRILLSNLLVYASSDIEANEARQVISEMAADHPTRAIIADSQSGEPGRELEADVSMLCSFSEYGRWLCGEEVRLHAHGVALFALGTIMPILVPDLPVFLWTPGDLFADDQVLTQLVRISDHWIVDSRRFSNWTERFRLVLSLGWEHESAAMLHDLAWTSLSQWREAVAEHFDPLPAREYLQGIKKVTISGSSDEGDKPGIEQVLMAVWLVSRLQWQEPEVSRGEDGSWTIRVLAGEHSPTIFLSSKADAKAPVDEIIIESKLGEKKASFRCATGDEPGELRLEAKGPDLPGIRRTLKADIGSTSNQIGAVLDMPDQDKLYTEALPMLQKLVLELEGRT